MDTEKINILIVDDIKDNLLALNALLQREDVNIFKAVSGMIALELMMKHDFCLAVLDVNMPIMSGFELAELMRGSKRTKDIPIIFVTATAKEQNFSFKGYESGAVDFLLKPLDDHAVKSKVNIFIELHKQKKELKNQLETIAQLAADLKLSKDEADRANASKSEFLAHMSHEIRTPIGAVLGFADLMKNPANSAEQNKEYMSVIERNSQQLLRLIDDILDVSKVEAGKITIEVIEFSLAEMLTDFVAMMDIKAKAKGIDFRFTCSTLVPNLISSDPYRLRQILLNIVGNAIKFTEVGFVELCVSYDNSTLDFMVTDTGAGISKEQETKLFQPFSQANNSTTRKYGGTGLGLVLSKSLAHFLGGNLEIRRSEVGVGSSFGIQVHSPLLPLAKLMNAQSLIVATAPAVETKSPTLNLRGLKVLIVEDNPDNQMLIAMYLRKSGAIVRSANDGAQGVELALTENFDILLMDIQMPVLDGHEATKKLRLSKYNKPIIALTANAMKEEREKCMQSGFTEFLTKPIQREQLIEMLAKWSVPDLH